MKTYQRLLAVGLIASLAGWGCSGGGGGAGVLGPMALESVSPSAGPDTGGMTVTVTGENFVSGMNVLFGDAPAADVTVVDGKTLVVTTPVHDAGDVDITAFSPSGDEVSLTEAFSFMVSPLISKISPNNGSASGGSRVALDGRGFEADLEIWVGDLPATDIVIINGERVEFSTPPGFLGSVDVLVRSANGLEFRVPSAFLFERVDFLDNQAVAAGVSTIRASRGASCADVNGDGLVDIYLLNGGKGSSNGSGNMLLLNNGDGTFRDESGLAGLANGGEGRAAAFFDMDRDGDLDLYLVNEGEQDQLYRNDGGARFVNVSGTSKVSNLTLQKNVGRAIATIDFDRDGWIDLYLGNGKEGLNSVNGLFRNWGIVNGGIQFRDRTEDAGIEIRDTTNAVAAFDYNGDGLTDLYVANGVDNRLSIPWNKLYRNNGDGTFTNVTGPARCGDAGDSRDVVVGDVDNDGDFDLYVVNNGAANRLFLNNGNGTFSDKAPSLGVDFVDAGRAAVFADLDNDGLVDFYVVNGIEAGLSGQNVLARNTMEGGTLSFALETQESGIFSADAGDGISVEAADFQGNGFVDLLVINKDGSNLLLNNRPSRNHFLRVELIDRTGAPAHGVKVTIMQNGRHQTRLVGAPGAIGDSTATFGFGRNASTVVCEIEWADGSREIIPNITVDQTVVHSQK